MSLHLLVHGSLLPVAPPTEVEVGLRIAFSLAMGACVGLERQWRAGLAGLRTNALVAVGAALFVVMGAYGFTPDGSADPTRVAAQVVSGIGFLGAGVMIREGLNIRGLNTAATLWCSAAIGCLAGTGMYLMTLVGTIVIVTANTLLRPLGRAVNRKTGRIPSQKETSSKTDFAFEVMTTDKAEPRVRALLLQTLSRPEYRLKSVTASHNKQGNAVALLAELQSSNADAAPLERAVTRMTLDPKVNSARWWLDDEDEHNEEDEF